jgi:hypothetical protein
MKDFLLILAIIAISVFCGYRFAEHRIEGTTADTIVIERWDTMFVEKPTEIIRYLTRIDTITITTIDTNGNLTPSTGIIPIETMIYADSTDKMQYTAFVSGFRASLDSICVNCFETERIITKIEREKTRKFGIGVQIGIGMSTKGFVPYAGLGVQYRLW